MSKNKLGQVVTTGSSGDRDAFHAPGVLVTAEVTVTPGSNLRLAPGSSLRVIPCSEAQRQGIADPFIKGDITRGQKFWMLLQPELVEGLTHNFTLKGIDDDGDDDYTPSCGVGENC